MKKNTIKVVFNDSYARPEQLLSMEAIRWMKESGFKGKFNAVPRHDPLLVECVETLGEKAWGKDSRRGFKAELKVAEIAGDAYYITDYDGKETVIGEKDLIRANKGKDLFVDSFPADKVYFTADTHFDSEALIHFCKRPFKDAADMEEELIRRWNETVPEDGIVFHLGDFAHGSAAHWSEILERLNGTIHLVTGNHDTSSAKEKGLENFASVRSQRMIEIEGQSIYLNHYPFLCYAGAYEKTWQLFGHVHSGPNSKSGLDLQRLKTLYPRQYDVGVDNNDFRPVSFAAVKAKIEAQLVKSSSEMAEAQPDSGKPIVFLEADGVLSRSPLSRSLDTRAAKNLNDLLRRSGSRIVISGGWASFSVKSLRRGPLKAFSESIVGTARQMESKMGTVAGYLASAGGKHPYVILSAGESDDTRAIRIDPTKGLTQKDVQRALEILKQGY